MNINIKDKRLLTHRTQTHRDVEDWREDRSPERQGPWAVQCLEHGERKFFPTYAKAKSEASLPSGCPVCTAFDQRCLHCPSDREEWQKDAHTGYTASAGHITGRAVCLYHQYGSIPEGVEYREGVDESLQRPLIEIFLGDLVNGRKVLSVGFHAEMQCFWLTSEHPPRRMSVESAGEYERALGFAVQVAIMLNERLKPISGDQRPYGFESWEAFYTRHGIR